MFKNSIKVTEKTWILTGIPLLFLISVPLHYLFKWSGELTVISFFSPINESVWEHLKLTYTPLLIWWALGYLIFRKKQSFSKIKWIVSSTISQLVSMFFIIFIFYGYVGVFGEEYLFVDIMLVLISLLTAQLFSLKNYLYSERFTTTKWLYFFIALYILLIVLFTIFTFTTPNIPLFQSPI